jgi:hypothetical protein
MFWCEARLQRGFLRGGESELLASSQSPSSP